MKKRAITIIFSLIAVFLMSFLVSAGTTQGNNCPWDVNKDSTISKSDVFLVSQNFGSVSPQFDVDSSGITDIDDVVSVILNWKNECAHSSFRVFVSSSITNGKTIQNMVGADLKCQDLAESANLGGNWKAWISSTDYNSVDSRFFHSEVPYVLLDNTRIANNWEDLTDSSIKNPIDIDENENKIRFLNNVWTGTSPAANPTYSHCSLWGGTGRAGTSGSLKSTDGRWTFDKHHNNCNFFGRLYCFEQPSK